MGGDRRPDPFQHAQQHGLGEGIVEVEDGGLGRRLIVPGVRGHDLDLGAPLAVAREALDVRACDLVQLHRELDPDDPLEGELAREQEHASLSGSVVHEHVLRVVDRKRIEQPPEAGRLAGLVAHAEVAVGAVDVERAEMDDPCGLDTVELVERAGAARRSTTGRQRRDQLQRRAGSPHEAVAPDGPARAPHEEPRLPSDGRRVEHAGILDLAGRRSMGGRLATSIGSCRPSRARSRRRALA
jgi:hypothetical protein